MIKTKIFAKIGLFFLITSLSFVFVGMAKISKGEKLEEKRTKILQEFNSSEDWKELKRSLLANAEKEYKEGRMSYAEYNQFKKDLETKDKIAKYIQNSQINQIDKDIEENKEEQKICQRGAMAGAGAALVPFLIYASIDDEEMYL